VSTTYTTKAGDVLDWICVKYYGSTENRRVEKVLLANPGLADYGPILPAGVKIVLPVIAGSPALMKRLFS